ncbi:glycosyltransferase [Spiroplasma endosymbiont of Amphibalanus improvisus]|uniref:glycosyltransferase n=1 Tax=Spiroplasma endosymbiont of Amphibalanus improvisus TaxID=3066327 RepID=UPI00313DA613
MLISFVVYFNKNLVDVIKTINSIKKQTLNNYEIIVINDSGYAQGNDLNDYIEEEAKLLNKQLKLIISSSSQGYTYAMNNAFNVVKGDYVMMAPLGGVSYDHDLCKNIQTQLKDTRPDLIEFIRDNNQKTNSKLTKVKTIKDNKKILVNMDSGIYNKLFKRELIIKNQLTFLNYTWYLQLFLYQFTFFADDYLCANFEIGEWKEKALSYSIFDLTKQWIKIFNWYRSKDIIQDFREELDYIYTRYLLLEFLTFVKNFYNKSVYNKAINEVRTRLKRRSKYISENEYILNENNADLSKIILEKGIGEYLKRV